MGGRLLQTLRPSEPDRRPLWLDAAAYGRQVILKTAELPWADAAAFIAFEREMHALLGSDVATFDVEGFYGAYLHMHPELRSAMGARSRPGFALKTMLAAPEPRSQQLELLRGLRASFGDRPLVLVIPSPHRWIGLANRATSDLETVEVSVDDTESGAVYVADFLNQFSEAAIDGLLLVETSGTVFDAGPQLIAYQPVLNVAAHYRWDVGLQVLGGTYTAGATMPIGFCISDGSPLAAVHATILAPGFWAGGEPPPAVGGAAFYYGSIPADAVPETVLSQLKQLKQDK